MKLLPISIKGGVVRRLLMVVLLATVTACTGNFKTDRTIAADRATAYVAAHPELSAETAANIRHLRVTEGMTMEQVIAAWGQPAVVNRYRNGAQQHWFFGCDWPHHCGDSDEYFPMPDEIFSSQVVFENGIAVDVHH